MRRTDSAYYSFCSMHHLPDVTDLVILEFDGDDPKCGLKHAFLFF